MKPVNQKWAWDFAIYVCNIRQVVSEQIVGGQWGWD